MRLGTSSVRTTKQSASTETQRKKLSWLSAALLESSSPANAKNMMAPAAVTTLPVCARPHSTESRVVKPALRYSVRDEGG